MRAVRFALPALFLLLACPQSSARQLSSDELAAILRIESWRVPLPLNEKYMWDFKVSDYDPRESPPLLPEAKPMRLEPGRKALVAPRQPGEHTCETTVRTSVLVIWGELKIDVCAGKGKAESRCDNTYSVWRLREPKPFADGTGFVIANIRKGDRPAKQIILRTVPAPRGRARKNGPAP